MMNTSSSNVSAPSKITLSDDLTPPQPTLSPKPTLSNIPGEIRNEIYHMLLTTRYTFHEKKMRFDLQPAILQVNKQIHAEAKSVLHGDNLWILFEIKEPEWSIFEEDTELPFKLPVVSKRIKIASHIKAPALRIHFYPPDKISRIYPGLNVKTVKPLNTFLLAEESIPFLVEMLWDMADRRGYTRFFRRSMLSLELGTSLFYPRSNLQTRCLDLFTLVRGLRKVTLEGDVDPEYGENFLKQVNSEFHSVSAILKVSNRFFFDENSSQSTRDSLKSLRRLHMGNTFLIHAKASLKRHKKARGLSLLEADYSLFNEYHATSTNRLAKLAIKIGCYDIAKGLADCILIDGQPGRVTGVELVKAMVYCSAAHAHLGEEEMAEQWLRRAVALREHDALVFNEVLDILPVSMHKSLNAIKQQRELEARSLTFARCPHALKEKFVGTN
ncbi:hypothetical protein MMC28_001852 [Mycoblastus sanguinarius]|nr:hypothetical protein [Mycoblastus sanguinarius]